MRNPTTTPATINLLEESRKLFADALNTSGSFDAKAVLQLFPKFLEEKLQWLKEEAQPLGDFQNWEKPLEAGKRMLGLAIGIGKAAGSVLGATALTAGAIITHACASFIKSIVTSASEFLENFAQLFNKKIPTPQPSLVAAVADQQEAAKLVAER